MSVNIKGSVNISVGFDELVHALEQSALTDILKLDSFNFIDILKTDNNVITYPKTFYRRGELKEDTVFVTENAKVVRLIKAVQEIVDAWHDYIRADGQEKPNEVQNDK